MSVEDSHKLVGQASSESVGQASRLSIEILAALPVYDVSPARAQRTRARCVARLRRTPPVGRGVSILAWLEPAAALAASIVYLAAAIRASMVLL